MTFFPPRISSRASCGSIAKPSNAWQRRRLPMTPAPVKPTIDKATLDRIDVRVGTIESVEDVPRSDKLVALRVNFGDHMRTVLAGIKTERADPYELVGRQALFVVNLEPRKMAGLSSEAMLFDL